MGLTTKRIAKLRKSPRGRFHDGHGLYLQVAGPRSASWILRYVRHGEERMLGVVRSMSSALQKHGLAPKAARLQLLDGIDPVEDRKAKKVEHALAAAKAMSFADCAASLPRPARGQVEECQARRAIFVARCAPTLFHSLGRCRSPASIPRWCSRSWNQSGRIRPNGLPDPGSHRETVLDWATVRGYRSGDNPAR